MSSNFGRGVRWNMASLAVLGVSGLVLNIIIGRVYGPETLGVFNQVVATYVLAGQAAAGGIHYSVLRAIAEAPQERQRVSEVTIGALVPALLGAAAVSGAYYVLRLPISDVLESPFVADGMAVVTPGLFCFGINKVLLGVVNGLGRMRAFAVYTATRYVAILVGLVFAWWFSLPGEQLAVVFTFAEALLLTILAVEVSVLALDRRTTGAWIGWCRVHVVYGSKSVVSAMVLELNARVDVLMLGLYLADTPVGIYSLAALFAEGVYQVTVVLQNNYNPILAQHFSQDRTAELRRLVRRARRWIVPAMVAGCALAAALYQPTIALLTGEPAFELGWWPFAILMTGIALASAHLPFMHALLMANRPGWHTVFMLSVVVINIAANATLIPVMGIAGAAAGTAIAFVASAVLLSVLVRWRVGIWL